MTTGISVSGNTGKWTVGWNKPGWSAPVPNTIEFASFEEAYDGFIAILRGEASRQVLTEYQRNTLEAKVRLLSDLAPYVGQSAASRVVAQSAGTALLVGNLIFWIAQL